MSAPTFVILIVCFASIALADDFKTTNGKEYKNAKVSRVEPDGIVLITKSGISKVYFTELPEEVQERFHYDPEKAAQYSAAEVEAAKQRLQQQQPSVPAAKAAPDVQKRAATASGNANVQSRNTPQKQQKQEEELRSAQTETKAMEAEARGDQFSAELIRIRAEYELRIRAAMDAGKPELANELRKQVEIKIIEALARKQRQGR